MRQKSYWLSLLALVLILTLSVQPALAYFTDSTQAAGSVEFFAGSKVKITEEVKDLVKTVTITNTEGSPVWVRAIAYVGSAFSLEVSGWGSTVGSDTWVYYGSPIAEGEATSGLKVAVTKIPKSSDMPMTSFNVGVQFESIPVEYDANGNPITPTADDWKNNTLDVVTINP